MTKVAVGSLNPTKIEAVRQAFTLIFPETDWQFEGVSVSSSVADQPMSDKECIRGAKNRAKRAMKKLKAAYGVGLEGGMQKIGDQWFECGWCVILNKEGEQGTGSSFRLEAPIVIKRYIDQGLELGDVIDIVFKTKDAKSKNGFFGLMTNDTVTRTSGYKDGVISALSRFLHPELFK